MIRPNRLLRHDAALLLRSFQDAFNRPGDILLLLAMLVVAGFAVADWLTAVHRVRLPAVAVLLALAPGLAAFSWQRFLGARLQWFIEHSPLAPDALGDARTSYIVCAHGLAAAGLILPFLAVLIAMLGQAWVTSGLAVLAYAAGVSMASLSSSRPRAGASPKADRAAPIPTHHGHQFLFRRMVQRQLLDVPRPALATALLALFLLFATTTAAVAGEGRAVPLQLALTLAPIFFVLALISRADPELMRFLPYAGIGPLFVAASFIAVPLLCLAVAAIAMLLVPGEGRSASLLIAIALFAGFSIVGVARCWLYPGRSARAVDLQVQLELAAALLLGLVAPPLAIVCMMWRMWLLRRHYLALLWVQP